MSISVNTPKSLYEITKLDTKIVKHLTKKCILLAFIETKISLSIVKFTKNLNNSPKIYI